MSEVLQIEQQSVTLPRPLLYAVDLALAETMDPVIVEAVPRDERINKGYWLKSTSDESLKAVGLKLTEIIEKSRLCTEDEYGACVAYALDLSAEDEDIADTTLFQVANKENQDVEQLPIKTQANARMSLWDGTSSVRRSRLIKVNTLIPLKDGRTPEGLVYSFISRRLG